MKNKLFPWQEECLEQWKANHFKGIVNVITGAGKTVLALSAAETLLSMDSAQPLKIKIIVPKTFLMYQWYNAINEELKIPYDDIGFFSGSYKTTDSRKIMIYVINSARYALTRHIADDIKNSNKIFIIADECHHYGSDENSKIFTFMKSLSKDIQFYTLGLSATPFGRNYSEVLIPALGKEIYRFTFYNALKADIINNFIVFNIGVCFENEELAAYEQISEKLGVALLNLKKKHPSLYIMDGSDFYTGLNNIIKTGSEETAELAKAVLFLSIKRKEIVYFAKKRIDCVISLMRLINKTSRIIIFSERIETADEIYHQAASLWPNEVGIYHSKLPKTMAKNTLRQFENFEIRILVSCKTLDEGLNISETDVGIIVSSTSSRRQRIQRLGRVLRKKRNARIAYFYYIYIENTSEENELLKELTERQISKLINVIDLRYETESSLFINPYYSMLLSKAISDIVYNNIDDKKINEFLRNAQLGLITGDWLLPEEDCIKKIEAASKKSERNYYITMLLLIRTCL